MPRKHMVLKDSRGKRLLKVPSQSPCFALWSRYPGIPGAISNTLHVSERLKMQAKINTLEIGQKCSMTNWRLEATTCKDHRFYRWKPDLATRATSPNGAKTLKTRHCHRYSRTGGESAFTVSNKNSGFVLTPLGPISASTNQYLNVSYDRAHIHDLQRNVTTVR